MILSEVAQKLGCRLEGSPEIEIRGVAGIESAEAGQITFLANRRYFPLLKTTRASAVLVEEGIALDRDATLPAVAALRSSNPYLAFAHALELFYQPPRYAPGIHPTAIVAPLAQVAPEAGVGPYAVIGEDAHVGAGTQIGAHSVIGAGCWIGENCRIHARVTLYAGVRLGSRVEVHSGAVIGADGFGYAFGEGKYWKFPQAGIVEIGDDVEIGANTTIDRGSLDDTRIAEGVKLDNLVHVGHNCQIGAHSVIAAQAGLSGSCVFGKRVVVGGQAGFGERCKLEDGSVIGGQSGVLGGKTIRSGETVWGTPARSLEKFKELFAWYGRLPELAARIKGIEEKLGGK